MSKSKNMAIFQGKRSRKMLHNGEWWFSINDVVEVLVESSDSKQYIKRMKQRDPELAKGWGQIATPLSIETAGGKQQVNCTNTEGAFRIIQSIPSPKAEPFKRWLAKVGYERVQEREDPELAIVRMRQTYISKGYSEEWIKKRIRGVDVRKNLTEEWDKRGIKEQQDYAILTAKICRAAFGMTSEQYKNTRGWTNRQKICVTI